MKINIGKEKVKNENIKWILVYACIICKHLKTIKNHRIQIRFLAKFSV